MRAPSADLLRALRRATAAGAAPGSPLALRHTNLSRAQSPLAMPITRRQKYHHSSQLSLARRVRALSTTTTAAAQNRQAPSSSQPGTPSTAPSRPPINPRAPKTHDRGPASKEDTQTDFSKMDILAAAGVEEPATSIDACTSDGFHLNNGVHTSGGKGVMLLGGEAFVWTPWMYTSTAAAAAAAGDSSRGNATFTPFLSPRGLLTFPPQTLGLLSLLYPKPDLLLVGTGHRLWMLSRETRAYISEELGIKVDVMDTPNAAAAYNLLVMERGVEEVGAILIPEGWAGR
ncbi:uncharacterized protein Z520_02413 [Fonsecaea multimorphosa CBS 102226]|uniref:NADH dehydrogenase [ubiquinone] 1 alpha subcomplex assembly factor 3 n=1 Tax=Fonsecaea multimorphosa CBS 102226 TaxID=1442371 RepID=A0A0D2KFL2_9EURO|nr:uncharacterized protein Z520_02413 [Fonsecaea multimorphosa CBS 102226]KIY02275.1 hypothetical protein Z520_02413 [Fonsecaea multimorphosa CBS 102226]OAL28923.1 hypothetical protein AYO22_02359 [Fonsecaea multimorphosa]